MKKLLSLILIMAIRTGGYMRILIFGFFLAGFSHFYAYSQEDTINTTVKMYNINLQEIQSKITYTSQETYIGKNALILYANNTALFFGKGGAKDDRNNFIEIIEKCIEWADTAKKNNVRQLTREIQSEVAITGVLYDVEAFYTDFIFQVKEIRGRVEIMLVINYRTADQDNAYRRSGNPYYQGRQIVFKEQDFNTLKEIFSDGFLAQFDTRAAEQRRLEELFQ